MEHDYVSYIKRDVRIVSDHPSHTQETPAYAYTSEPEERIGCKVCNMSLDEALTLPCPGISLEDMMEGIFPEGIG